MKNPLAGVLPKSSVEHSLGGHARRPFGVETCLAEDRASAFLDCSRFKGDLALRAALATDGIMHLPVLHALVLALASAVLAPLGCRELLARIELLFTIGEHKCLSAIAAL